MHVVRGMHFLFGPLRIEHLTVNTTETPKAVCTYAIVNLRNVKFDVEDKCEKRDHEEPVDHFQMRKTGISSMPTPAMHNKSAPRSAGPHLEDVDWSG
ncbi:uncharacterized protein LOC107803119 isoform X4 [Nicotiana tabacum]|uniref:Uncharacterized protein LOC107803119 isoform X4 n=1 Tax=Nicotiana tabacum TaxID=4097 RepID=A0A1S4AZV4_TOBAC|nr:PREDICTED: uncharacterized protein LOC107803119 isoform X4 [Nicotiana tabacum]